MPMTPAATGRLKHATQHITSDHEAAMDTFQRRSHQPLAWPPNLPAAHTVGADPIF